MTSNTENLRYTKLAYEILLNRKYAEMPLEEVIKVFPYKTTASWIRQNYNEKRLGTYYRQKDPTGFAAAYKQWKQSQKH